MPDVHLAEGVCVGMVVATGDTVYPQAVGADIGFGMAAIRFDCESERLADEAVAARLLAGFQRKIPAIRHAATTAVQALPEPLLAQSLSHPRLESMKRRDARVEFATLGRGNHFVELQRCEQGGLWMMLHSGSRAMGCAISSRATTTTSTATRTDARKTISVRALERQMEGVWFDHRAAEELRDEAPAAYKDVTAVMRAQRDLVRVVRRLEPLLSYKAV